MTELLGPQLVLHLDTSRRVLADEQPRSRLPVRRSASLRTSGCMTDHARQSS